MERKFESVRLPPGVRKGIPKVYLFQGKSGKWVLRTRSHIIHKFFSQEDAESWWNRLCDHRGSPLKKINYFAPTAKARSVDIGPAVGVSKEKVEKLARDAVTSGYEPK
ncbi:hypothetical protein [Vibrio superstes]|uniref:Uncharacterized protein n=1 Tax=Vibrio superstes NBRC 103154 TaxID=1219062 RepID=A0A511QLI8_9VIBR|nr:hypothetical protein [Vibrio superstes]GEM77866.1 hypothetical protein VSU01S_01110 [Vibrio superstes NBRC 103154]